MLLKIDLEQDAELRNSIKKLVEGQIKSILNESFNTLAEQRLDAKLASMEQSAIEEKIKEGMFHSWYNSRKEEMRRLVDQKVNQFAINEITLTDIRELVANKIVKKILSDG